MKDVDGLTSLALACKNGHVEIFKCLIKNGAEEYSAIKAVGTNVLTCPLVLFYPNYRI